MTSFLNRELAESTPVQSGISQRPLESFSKDKTLPNSYKTFSQTAPEQSNSSQSPPLPNSQAKPGSAEETQKHCAICSQVVLRQMTNATSYWYCPHCHEKFSDDLIKIIEQNNLA